MTLSRISSVAGRLHIVANATQDVGQAMKCWQEFNGKLKQPERLASHKGRLQRLVATCVRGSAFEGSIPMLLTAAPHLYEKRCCEVYHFCSKVRDSV